MFFKMKVLFCVALLVAGALGKAQVCTDAVCKLANGCACSSSQSPIETSKTPQFVVPTFDDAVTRMSYDQYYKPLLENRKNPDGSKITATFFVPHEYTDYTCVNELYNAGYEIGTHSISKDIASHWINASEELLTSEFRGQKQILEKFGKVPFDSVIGARVPYLQMNGNRLFNAYNKSGIKYDSSWNALSTQRWFPYSLHCLSEQTCLIGTCPDESYDIWVAPIINLVGNNSKECNGMLGCEKDGSAEELKDWLVEQFEQSYNNSRAPITLMLNTAWFSTVDKSVEALGLFFDHLSKLKDVFIVSQWKVIEWAKKPVEAANYKSPVETHNVKCEKKQCDLMKGEEYRFMTFCGEACPAAYPWVNDPEGLGAK